MAWSHVQDTPGSNGFDTASVATVLQATAFGSPNTLGNVIAVFFWAWSFTGSGSASTCSDNAQTPNTYTKLFEAHSSTGDYCALFVAPITSLPSAGNLRPQVTLNTNTSRLLMACSEFAGGTSTVDGAAVTATGNSVSPATGNLSTTLANDLLLAVLADNGASQNNPITPPSGFTSVGQQPSGTSTECGQGCYQILAGTVTNLDPTWTSLSSTANNWACGVVALEPSAGGSHRHQLLGVGN